MAIDIRLVKLVSGEELLTEILEDSVTFVRIKRPVRLQIIPPDRNDEEGIPKIGFAAYIPYVTDQEFFIQKSQVLFVATPVAGIIDQYKEIFGLRSSLIVPNFGNSNDPLAAVKGFDPLAAIKAAAQDN